MFTVNNLIIFDWLDATNITNEITKQKKKCYYKLKLICLIRQYVIANFVDVRYSDVITVSFISFN
jgi:hypothetical protein